MTLEARSEEHNICSLSLAGKIEINAVADRSSESTASQSQMNQMLACNWELKLASARTVYRRVKREESTTYQEDKKGMGFAWLLGNWRRNTTLRLGPRTA